MKKQILQAVAAAVLLGATSMAALAQNAAIVNGKPVPKARMDVLAQQLAAAGRPVTPEMQTQLREEIIAREVFMQEAQKQGLDAGDDYKNQLELARQAILIRALFENYRKTSPVSDADVKAEYDKFVAANGGKEYKARHILVETEDQAKKIMADLKKGAKFEDIAKKQSKDPGSGANGGDLVSRPSGARCARSASTGSMPTARPRSTTSGCCGTRAPGAASGGEAAVRRGHAGQAAGAAVRVERIALGGLAVVVHEAHRAHHLGLVAAQREVGIALAVRHRDRQARAGHALQEQAGRFQHFHHRQARLEALAAVGGEARPGLGAGDDAASSANIWQPLHTPSPKVSCRPKKAWNCSDSTGLKVMLRAQPMPAPSVSP
jgi:hypothetical protein